MEAQISVFISKGLSNKLICSTTIVVACAILHNLSLLFNDILPEEEMFEQNNNDNKVPADAPHWQPGEGLTMRAALIERLFR